MALMQLINARKLESKRAALNAAQEKRAAKMQRRSELEEKEKELDAAIGEVTQETSEEDKAELEKAVDAFAEEAKAVEAELEEAQQEIEQLESEIEQLQQQDEEMAARARRAAGEQDKEKRSDVTMETRKGFAAMSREERAAFVARDDVKAFIQRVREMGREKRAVKGGELLVPEVVLPMLRQTAEQASKLMRHVNLESVSGNARKHIAGTIPEPIWMEACGKLNELEIGFADVEVDGYKVGGYIPVDNAVLEDSDIDLAGEVFDKLGRAIGLGVDMAILYGTGKKMPLGILTRLAQTTKPEDYPTTARAWENLSATNVTAISGKTGAALFKEIILAAGKAKNEYAAGGMFWAMSNATRMKLCAEALSINAAGAIVTGVENSMPVIGGAIETLNFIPDDVILGGYEGLYLLAERSGAALAMSEHVRFTDDQTVFKGTARYDGKPVIAEGFVAIGIGGTKPSATAVTFRKDEANEAAAS